jgi:hypothetical protein
MEIALVKAAGPDDRDRAWLSDGGAGRRAAYLSSIGIDLSSIATTYHPLQRCELGYFGQNRALTDDKWSQWMTSRR